MLDFTDKPYQFFPPKPNAFVTSVAQFVNRRFILPGSKHRIRRIELRGAERILDVVKDSSRCLLLPNHSTHSDPQVMLEVQRRLRIRNSMMAAYDVFLRGPLQAWLMQKIGCFSIDREGSDKQAMNCAVEMLAGGERALTIFPEGNVLLMNDRVTPFLGGAAFIGMRAQKKVGSEKPIYAIPVAMKYTHLADCREAMLGYLEKLETDVGVTADSGASARARLRRVGFEILGRNLRQRGYLPPEDHMELQEVLEQSALQIICKLEEKIGLECSGSDPPLERIRRIRATIHQIRIDESRKLDHRVATTWADEAILALRILGYSSDYLSESPTLDRHCEVLEKLREDLVEKILKPIEDRGVVVQFGEPVNLADYLGGKSRQVLPELTRQFEAAVQGGLDELAAQNDSPGGMLLE